MAKSNKRAKNKLDFDIMMGTPIHPSKQKVKRARLEKRKRLRIEHSLVNISKSLVRNVRELEKELEKHDKHYVPDVQKTIKDGKLPFSGGE